jgi:5-carboxymethyl-2-hydroxymuconate isomerase
MPHFIAECTDNIREQADLPGLFAKVNEALAATGIFPIGGIRSRAHWLDTWQMADGRHDYAFVHMTLKIGAGRSLESREAVGEMLFALIKTHFAALMASRYLALSFELDELHPTLNYKQNNVHALFKYRPLSLWERVGWGSALSHGEREKTNVKQDIAMLDKHTHTLIAHRLHQAEQSREQIRQISLDYPTITIDDAYAVQREWVSLKIAEGRVLKGHKIGLTSKAMQASSQISEPDYGALLDDMFFHDGSDIPVDRFIVPRIEVELAFVLAKPLRGPNCTIFDVYNATDYVIPALELIDARCHNVDPETQRPRKVFDTISDNAANAG